MRFILEAKSFNEVLGFCNLLVGRVDTSLQSKAMIDCILFSDRNTRVSFSRMLGTIIDDCLGRRELVSYDDKQRLSSVSQISFKSYCVPVEIVLTRDRSYDFSRS